MFRTGALSVIRGLRNMSTSTERVIGPIESTIIQKLTNQFNPLHLTIRNDSHKHAGHNGLRNAANMTESHFRIEIVSDAFKGKTHPARHRLIYQLLNDEIEQKGVHALQMKTKTPEEWEKSQK